MRAYICVHIYIYTLFNKYVSLVVLNDAQTAVYYKCFILLL